MNGATNGESSPEKTEIYYMRTAKVQISLHICTNWFAAILLVSMKIFQIEFRSIPADQTSGKFNNASALGRSLYWCQALHIMNKDRYQSTSARRALALLNSPLFALYTGWKLNMTFYHGIAKKRSYHTSASGNRRVSVVIFMKVR